MEKENVTKENQKLRDFLDSAIKELLQFELQEQNLFIRETTSYIMQSRGKEIEDLELRLSKLKESLDLNVNN